VPSRPADPPPGTRDVIARHARVLFAERGYAATSVRRIAAAAGVDPALVIRHFGSKEELFVDELARRLAGPDAELRARLVAAQLGGLIQAWSDIGDEQLPAADLDRVVELYGRAVQRLVDPTPG